MSKQVQAETLERLDESVTRLVELDPKKDRSVHLDDRIRNALAIGFPSNKVFTISEFDIEPGSESIEEGHLTLYRQSKAVWNVDYEGIAWYRRRDDQNPLRLKDRSDKDVRAGEKRAQQLQGILDLFILIQETRNN